MAGTGMYGTIAKQLLQELRASDWLPAYNDELVRKVQKEIKDLSAELQDALKANGEDVADTEDAVQMIVLHDSAHRNKRCLLAYHEARLQKLQALRWDTGGVLPEHVKGLLSSSEMTFFQEYAKLAAEYMGAVGLDLTEDLEPPKDTLIEVQVLEDCGELATARGTLRLDKHSRVHAHRSDVVHLIRQGKLAQCTD